MQEKDRKFIKKGRFCRKYEKLNAEGDVLCWKMNKSNLNFIALFQFNLNGYDFMGVIDQ